MRKSPLIIAALTGLMLVTQAPDALAKDCGLAPGAGPSIPDGATTNSDEIGRAIRAVQDYGFEVQVYTACMNTNKEDFFMNMNDAQRERWVEDFNILADNLTLLETSLNDQITIYNTRF